MRLIEKPLRICVQDIFKGQGASFSIAGRIESGDVQNGDKVLVMPAQESASVKGTKHYRSCSLTIGQQDIRCSGLEVF